MSAKKPALDPSTVNMWTLSANDINDDDVVSHILFPLVCGIVSRIFAFKWIHWKQLNTQCVELLTSLNRD